MRAVESSTTSPAAVSHAEAKAHLGRVLASNGLSQAPMLRRLLAYLGDAALSSSPDSPKEYAIGVAVFDRGEGFDPQSDTIVRVQARRLRAKLQDYYEEEGKGDPVEIRLPKGRYRLDFLPRAALPRETAPFGENGLSLPAERTRLIGRDTEIAKIRGLLLDRTRLITLTGAGGSGKTRVAIQAARLLRDEFPGGVSFISLEHTTDPEMAAAILAQWLAPPGNRGGALGSRLRGVSDPARLLVLDNFEQVLAAAPLVGRLLDVAESLHIMVTSRCALGLYGEHEFPIRPFRLPDTREQAPLNGIQENFGVQLFCERAKALDSAFELTESNASAIARICARLDGLPLAIELAAARIRVLSPSQILERLTESLDSLQSGTLDWPERHQTLRRVVHGSYHLLSGAEQKLFRRLSVFAGGCTLESAEAVANAMLDSGLEMLDGVNSLVARSLLRSDADPDAGKRFTMLATVREYAMRLLREQEDEFETRRAHAAYCIVIAQEGSRVAGTAQQASWLELCEREHDNFRVALDWLIGTRNTAWAVLLAKALHRFWELWEHLSEGRRYILAVLELMGETPTRDRARLLGIAASLSDLAGGGSLGAQALDTFRAIGDRRGIASANTSMGNYEKNAGNHARSVAYMEEALAVTRELGNERETAAAMSNLAVALSGAGGHAAARVLLDGALGIFARLGDGTNVGWTLNRLGDATAAEGKIEEARQFYREAVTVFDRLGDRLGTARCYQDLGLLALRQHDPERARTDLHRALDDLAQLGYRRGITRILDAAAIAAAMQGDSSRAVLLAGAADGLRSRIGYHPRPSQYADVQRWLQAAWDASGDAAPGLWVAGRRLSPVDAIELARSPSRTAAALLEFSGFEHAPDSRNPVDGDAG